MGIKLYKITYVLVYIVLHACSSYRNYMTKNSHIAAYQEEIPELPKATEITQQQSQKKEQEAIVNIAYITYSNKIIKSLLKSYLPNASIEDIYLFKATGDHIYYNIVNDLKTKLISAIKDKLVSGDKFYVIIEQTINNDLQVSSATILKLYSESNKNQLQILPVIDSAGSVDLLKKQLKSESKELKKLRMMIDDIPEWYNAQLSINIINLIEILRLSIEHKSPYRVPDDKIKKIINTPYTEYEKSHQELLNSLKLTDSEAINQLIPADNQDKSVESRGIKRKREGGKAVSWGPAVEDNEGHTIRTKKRKIKKKDEVEKYFEDCIKSWNWDPKIWEERYFNTNKLNYKKFKDLLDKLDKDDTYCTKIRGTFGGHIISKHHYDSPNDYGDYDGSKRLKEEQLNKIIDGYIFLIEHSPNLLNLFREYQESMLKSFSENDIDMLGFYNNHPELKLINLIEKRIGNIDINAKDQNSIIIPISDNKTDTEILVNITNYSQENSELELTRNIIGSYE